MKTFLHFSRQVTEDIEPCGWSKRQARNILKFLLSRENGRYQLSFFE